MLLIYKANWNPDLIDLYNLPNSKVSAAKDDGKNNIRSDRFWSAILYGNRLFPSK